MAPLNPPAWLQAGTYPARYDRLAIGSMLPPLQGTGPLAARSGVRPSPSGAGLQVTQRATPGMFVTVAAGSAFIQSPSATGGVYVVENDAPYDVAITTAHPTLGRRDLVVARIYDAEVTGALNQWTLEVVTGTPAASPVTPAAPSGALPLASVLVGAGVTSITNAAITDLRSYTVALGGTIPAPASALPANPYTGMAAYDLTNGVPRWYNGSSWVGWRDEGYATTATVTALLSSGGYMSQAAMDAAGYKTTSYVVKSSNTSRTNTTNLSADPHLTLPVAANSIYRVEVFVIYEAATDADIVVGFTGPSGCDFDWVSDMITSTVVSGAGSDEVSRTAQGLTNTPTGGGRGAGFSTVAPIHGMLRTSSSSGSLTLRWAQGTAQSTPTTVFSGSFMMLTKLA